MDNTVNERLNSIPLICKCGVDLNHGLCVCLSGITEEETPNDPPTFSPDVLSLAMQIQEKVDRIKKAYGNVQMLQMKATVTFDPGTAHGLSLLDEEDSPITCTAELVAIKKQGE